MKSTKAVRRGRETLLKGGNDRAGPSNIVLLVASVFLHCSHPLSGLTHRKVCQKGKTFNHVRDLSYVEIKRLLS